MPVRLGSDAKQLSHESPTPGFVRATVDFASRIHPATLDSNLLTQWPTSSDALFSSPKMNAYLQLPGR